MKKIFLSLSIAILSSTVNAAVVTVYKNLYSQIEATPTGSGDVYLEPATDNDLGYIKDTSMDYGNSAFLKVTLESNGDEGQSGGTNSGNPCFLIKAYAEPAIGYELVCYTNIIRETGIYGPGDCYVIFNQTNSDGRAFSFTPTGLGDIINVNNVKTHSREDGTSADDTPSKDEAFNTGIWEETPDANIYAIFRKVGDELPKLDMNFVPDAGEKDDITTNISTWTDAIYIEPISAMSGQDLTLSIKMKNKNPITGIEFQVEVADSVGTLGTPVLSTQRTSETRTNFFDTTTGNSVKTVAFSYNNDAFDGNDGEIATVNLHVKEGIELKNYEIKVNNVVMAGLDAVAVKPGEAKAALKIVDPTGITHVGTTTVDNGKIYRINGIEVKDTNANGIYIKEGKTILVK